MALKTMNDLFVHGLKDIYFAEKALLRSLPAMAKGASADDLKAALEVHLGETERQIVRLERIFDHLGQPARGIRCEAMDSLILEASDVMDEVEDPEIRDAGILAAIQTIEHYEISRYGTLIAWANQLGLSDIVKLLQQSLGEEKSMEQVLSRFAICEVRQTAA